jgi:hypothetical protein
MENGRGIKGYSLASPGVIPGKSGFRSAAATDQAKRDARRLGAVDFLEKPIDSRPLLDRINDVRR